VGIKERDSFPPSSQLENIFMSELVSLDENGNPIVVEDAYICSKCKIKKAGREFAKSQMSKTGKQSYCRKCMEERNKAVLMGLLPSRAGLGGREKKELSNLKIKKIAHMLIENPDQDLAVIAAGCGLSIGTVKNYVTRGRVLRALRGMGAKRVSSMIPQAVKAYEDLLRQRDNLTELNKVATKVLENEKVIGPNRVDIGLVEMKEESTENLMRMVKEVRDFPEQVIMEAEVVE
jgi:hypothetical protein